MHLLLHASLEYFFGGGGTTWKGSLRKYVFSCYDKAVIDFLEIIPIKRTD